MDAYKIQSYLVNGLLRKPECIYAITEHSISNKSIVCDVYAIFNENNYYYSYDYEVKIEEKDLLSELKTIDNIINKEKYKKRLNKYKKHKMYLSNNIKSPNYFFFVIPENLLDLCAKHVEKTKYGIITYEFESATAISFSIRKYQEKINNKSIDKNYLISRIKTLCRCIFGYKKIPKI
jgi:hypothetical protein